MGLRRRREWVVKATRIAPPRPRLATLEDEVRRRVQAILQRQAEVLGTDAEELVQRLGASRIDAILEELDWDGAWEEPLRRELARVTREVIVTAGDAELHRAGLARELSFALDNPRMLRHGREYIPELVREITQETREALRDVLAAGYEEGRTARQIGRDIRGTVGLTRRQVASVLRLRASMQRRGVDEERIVAAVQREYQRQIRRRAELIARTETIRAYNTGQQAAWEQAAGDGFIDAAEAKRFWIASPSSSGRTCDICEAIARENAQGIGLNEPFQLPGGGTIDMPPAHPACRCSVGMRFT